MNQIDNDIMINEAIRRQSIPVEPKVIGYESFAGIQQFEFASNKTPKIKGRNGNSLFRTPRGISSSRH